MQYNVEYMVSWGLIEQNLIDMKKLCRKARSIKNLQQGKLYTVDHIHECNCGTVSYGLREVKSFDIDKDPKLKSMCTCNKRINYYYPLFNSNRFEDISELTVEEFLKEKTDNNSGIISCGLLILKTKKL